MSLAQVKVLVEGYAREENGREFASSTVVLVKDNGLNIVVDPGLDRKLLLKALKKEKLPARKVDFVLLTHYHLDHALLSGLFKNARIIDGTEIYSWNGEIEKHNAKIPGTGVKIIKTPGHDMFHCAALAETREFGVAAIAGDVFWWPEGEKQKTDRKSLLLHNDPYAKNREQLLESRKKILKAADWVIPGHGKMFKVEN